ncbi:MAG: hypothetical protein E6J39_02940 [Chloroflexi bacterium]|nr:MAG: hypothetical protein E6J39_02940 [Chloroflexota bacterium]
MSAFGSDIFEPASITQVALDLYTTDYRISGTVSTRFNRVADILNQVTLTHIPLVHATISEYDNPTGTLAAEHVHVPVAEVLFCVASTDGGARPEMRVAKRPIKAQIAVPPFRLTGNVHVTQGSRPVDGLLNATDQFMAMTDAAVACARYPELDRTASALAVQRRRAHVLLVADDERPDELLAEVLDERTASDWLVSREPRSEV